MTTYRSIVSTETDPLAPIVSALMKALAANPSAIAEGATGAPPVKAGWVPYDMIALGDGNDGVIWDHAIDGSVASVTTPDFAAGYEYLLFCDAVSNSLITTHYIDAQLTGGTWVQSTTAINIGNAGRNFTGAMMFHTPSLPRRVHSMMSLGWMESDGTIRGDAAGVVTAVHSGATTQTVDRARVRATAGVMDAGKIKLYKRGGFVSA